MKTLIAITAVAATAALLLGGCSSSTPTPAKSSAALSGAIVVDAASSLTGIFDQIATGFTKAHPGTTITFNYGASSALATSITSGAPVDLFASASPATMTTVTDANLAKGTPTTFVSNTLEIAVPAGNPGKITGLADFADASKKIAICAPEVPCGAAAVTIFSLTGIKDKPDTLEPDVKTALTQVSLGEVDAALVYHTDVLAAGSKVEGIEFPEAQKAINNYLIAPISSSKNPKLASAFEKYILSPAGAEILKRAGFTVVG
ncbi:MAG TPA: molybdate ABC transporter substrate-binding protein [Galbitalea sp.]|jgi:molybdate transport system substrate-binding protein